MAVREHAEPLQMVERVHADPLPTAVREHAEPLQTVERVRADPLPMVEQAPDNNRTDQE